MKFILELSKNLKMIEPTIKTISFLSKVINDMDRVDQAMDLILNNREIVTTYKLTKPKR